MCIFCQIIQKEIPGYVVYEDEKTLAILDMSQVTKGHTLVMPKKHVEDILDADEETLSACICTVKKVAQMQQNHLHANGINVLNNCKEVAGQTVNHLHFHVIPRYSNSDAIHIAFNESAQQDLSSVLQEIKG